MLVALLVSLRGPRIADSSVKKNRFAHGYTNSCRFSQPVFSCIFSSVDMLMVNRLLPDEAGIYAVTAKYGQILFFAALSVATVFVPQLSRARTDPTQFRALTKKLLGILTTFTLLALGCSFTVFPATVGPVFGAVYAPAGALLPLAVLAYGLLALCFCLVNVLVVLASRTHLLALLAACLVVVISLCLYHATLSAVLAVLASVYGALLLGLGALVWIPKDRNVISS